ncbi:FYVE zinc finger, partial [Ancylostoma duodenale]
LVHIVRHRYSKWYSVFQEDEQPSPAPPCDRFGAQVIATIHDLSQESDPMRLTESELQLGKSKPYWIPDDDCSMCMLCNARFSLLNRRHHCRACGRVACGSCCKERATLQYMKDEPKKQGPARVCTPCASMLARIEDYEKMMREHAEGGASDEITPSTSSGSRVARGVLKTRGTSIGESEAETSQPSEGHEKKRSVVFRDGVKPGATSPSSSADPAMEEKSTTVKPKKKSRKRHAVARRVAELRLEDELGCALPTASRPQLLVVCPNGEMDMVDEEWVKARLKEELSVTIVLKKNLSCVVKICTESNMSVFCVHSCGFATIGLDEVLFVWKRENVEDFTVPLNVLHRIAQIYSSSCDADQAGVRQVCSRLPAIHSVPIALPPLSRHILFFPPTLQVFTDFRSWSFRMKHLVGCTVTLCNDVTTVEIPKSAKQDLDEIISWNRTMIAWTTDVNLSADSHLVCEETDGFYSTQVLARGSSRKATGTSFIIIDGGLKTSGLQISVVEDGVAIRIPSEKLESLLVALDSMEDWMTIGASGSQFSVHWVDICPQSSSYGPISPIDGLNLADKYQYGLSLDRAISSVLQVASVPDYGVRLSHVYNLKDGRLTPDDEPKVFSIAEMLARECTGMLEPYLTMLINMNIMSISVRVGVSTEKVEYDVSPWCGMEDEQMKYKQNMDQIYSTSCDADQAGVRQVCSRLPAIHSVPIALPPLSRHILFFPPTLQDFSNLPVPSSPFLVALFLCDAELPWAMACPNRLLLRLGLKYSWYPTPIVNIVGREATYTTETSQTVLKVFTDFRSWSFRMKHLVGCTVTLCNDVTTVEIPKSAKQDLDEIISWNRTMIAWTTDVNLSADSHLVCEETDGFYSTQVLARGSSRKATGTSFVIIDGGLKTSGLQAIEDGVAIRIPSEKLESLLVALDSMEDWMTIGASGSQFSVHWVDVCPQSSSYGPISPIDGLNLADKYQYGLSLDRAISSVLQVASVPDYGVRLSHVYNLKDGRLTPDDEPKVFSIAEMLARECTGMLEPYLTMLINMNIMSISVRVGVSTERVEYDVSPWCGMEDERMKYKQNMDQLIPVLYDILGYLSACAIAKISSVFIISLTAVSGIPAFFVTLKAPNLLNRAVILCHVNIVPLLYMHCP